VVACFWVCHVGNIFNLPYRYNFGGFQDEPDSKPARNSKETSLDDSDSDDLSESDEQDSGFLTNLWHSIQTKLSSSWTKESADEESETSVGVSGSYESSSAPSASLSPETPSKQSAGPAILCFSAATINAMAASLNKPTGLYAGSILASTAYKCGATTVMDAFEKPYLEMIGELRTKQAGAADPALYTNRPDVYNQFNSFADAMRGKPGKVSD